MHGGKKRANWDFPLKGIVVFDEERQSTFIRFDPTAVRLSAPWNLSRMVKRQLTPVLSELAALPRSQENVSIQGSVRPGVITHGHIERITTERGPAVLRRQTTEGSHSASRAFPQVNATSPESVRSAHGFTGFKPHI
jgi:hypothetical protein